MTIEQLKQELYNRNKEDKISLFVLEYILDLEDRIKNFEEFIGSIDWQIRR